jgi:hypothetical protein
MACIRPVGKPTYAEQHVIRVLGLLSAGECVQLQHEQRAKA